MFSRGNGLGTEYRYMLGPQAQGNLRYYWLDENEAIVNGTPQPARQSKTIQGGLSQNLPFGLSARGRVDYFTNVIVQQTHNHDFTQATNSNRTIDGGVSGSWRNLSVNALFNRNETFYNEDQSTVSGRAPGFTAALSGVKLGPLPIFATVNAEAARVLYIENFGGDAGSLDSGLSKVDVAPSIRAPLSTLPFLQVNATAAYRTTYFSESLADDLKTQVEVPITRKLRRPARRGGRARRVARLQSAERHRRSHEARRRAELLGAAAHRDRQPGSHSDPRRRLRHHRRRDDADELRPDQPPDGAQGRRGSAVRGRAARAAQRLGAAELLHGRQREQVRHLVFLWLRAIAIPTRSRRSR